MTNVCPICQKDDLVQRVETLVAAGQSSGTFSGPSVGTTYSNGKLGSVGGYTTLSGSSSSNLAKLLEPPSPPPTPKGYGCWWILLAYPVIPIVGAIFSIPFMIPGMILMAIGENPDTLNMNFIGIFGIILTAIGGIIGYWLCIRFFIKESKKKKATMEKVFNEAKPKWEIAMRRWKRLYYCHRDGIVYDPEAGDTCVPESVNDFVYEKA
jgi:hypothetical protein